MIPQHSVNIGDSIHYSSYEEFLTDAMANGVRPRDMSSSRRYDAMGFSLTKTWDDAVELATKGWEAGTKLVSEYQSKLLTTVCGGLTDQTMYLDLTTQYCYDMQSAIAGVPQCGVNFAPEGNRKLIRIMINVGARASVSAETMRNKAAIVSALVLALELYHDVEIVVIRVDATHTRKQSNSYQLSFTLKHAGEPLNTSLLAFAVGHPAMLRRMIFSWHELYLTPNAIAATGGNIYGWSIDIKDTSNFDIYIGAATEESHWDSPILAEEWIKKQLRLQGVEIG